VVKMPMISFTPPGVRQLIPTQRTGIASRAERWSPRRPHPSRAGPMGQRLALGPARRRLPSETGDRRDPGRAAPPPDGSAHREEPPGWVPTGSRRFPAR
jgi:hypothetical protein